MKVIGPTTYTVGQPTQVVDPAANGGNPSAAVQVQNSSAYQLIVNAGGTQLSIQPFWAQTIEISGQPITITPEAGTGTGSAVITLAYLLGTPQGTGSQLPDGSWVESPPQDDGSLTAAAITAAISGLVTSAVSVTPLFAGTMPSTGFNQSFTLTAAAIQGLQLWMWLTANSTETINVIVENVARGEVFQFATTVRYLNNYPSPLTVNVPVSGQVGDTITVIITPSSGAQDTELSIDAMGLLSPGVMTPIAVTAVAEMAGLLGASANWTGLGNFNLLAAPPAGLCYRLQNMVTNVAQTSTGYVIDGATGRVLGVFLAGVAGVNVIAPGQVCLGALTVQSAGATPGGTVYATYDQVAIASLP